MEQYYQIIFVLIAIRHLIFVAGVTLFHLEIESYVMDKFTINRDTSKGYGSVNFKQGDSFKIYFCLREETLVSLNNVRYSNDGGSDLVEFGMDGIRLGVLNSHDDSNFGRGWNNFMLTGPIGPNLTLPSGRHFITVNINKTDFYGIELDQLEIFTKDSFISEEIFKCSLFCDDDITYSNGPARDDMSSAVLVRKSLQSACRSNKKNILLPIYHENAEMYLITVMHPKYRSFENHFDESGLCTMDSDTVWEFTNIEVKSSSNTINSEDDSKASLKYGGSNISKSLFIKITFEYIKQKKLETMLVVQFERVTEIFVCSCKYKNQGGLWNMLKNAFISPQKTKHIWTIPRDTWLESNEVVCNFLIDPNDVNNVILQKIKLDIRVPTYKTSDVLFSSYDTKIEVYTGTSGENRKSNNTMSVINVNNDAVFMQVTEIVISQRLPWADIYSPVVKLSEMGELYVSPIAPHGLSAIPFGPSIIIGSNDQEEDLPAAPISSIEIAPEALQLLIKFKDKSSANMLIKSTWKDTKVIFKDIVTTKDPLQYPFATVLSTWHYDGNADIDHVNTNGDTAHHIVKGWNKLYGTSFTFFRRCISRYNTQSPDLRLQLINEKDLYLYV